MAFLFLLRPTCRFLSFASCATTRPASTTRASVAAEVTDSSPFPCSTPSFLSLPRVPHHEHEFQRQLRIVVEWLSVRSRQGVAELQHLNLLRLLG
ncbi:hypothetical protein SORBI_3002G028901 [Sorghum bicolor]|uniref:Secreted protein n=1 Tax=Sorghum bicolor TaxID=4558 RepID=A0A1W0W1Z3_SORBI|nr:hypothetical protein SORBI_3002G028901 [Sorghum bicolor]